MSCRTEVQTRTAFHFFTILLRSTCTISSTCQNFYASRVASKKLFAMGVLECTTLSARHQVQDQFISAIMIAMLKAVLNALWCLLQLKKSRHTLRCGKIVHTVRVLSSWVKNVSVVTCEAVKPTILEKFASTCAQYAKHVQKRLVAVESLDKHVGIASTVQSVNATLPAPKRSTTSVSGQ